MAEPGSGKKSIVQLILVPSLITLAITVLRVEGELHHWGSPWFSSSAGGGGAIVGISWLPIIFGPYFALKLAGSGEGTSSYGKAFVMTIGGLVVMVLGGFALLKSGNSAVLGILGFVLTLVAAFGQTPYVALARGLACEVPGRTGLSIASSPSVW
jgi:hypothetical protein